MWGVVFAVLENSCCRLVKVIVGFVFGLLKLIGEPVPGSWSTPTLQLSAGFRIGTKEGARKSTNLSGWFVTEKTTFGCLSSVLLSSIFLFFSQINKGKVTKPLFTNRFLLKGVFNLGGFNI